MKINKNEKVKSSHNPLLSEFYLVLFLPEFCVPVEEHLCVYVGKMALVESTLTLTVLALHRRAVPGESQRKESTSCALPALLLCASRVSLSVLPCVQCKETGLPNGYWT